MRGSPDMASAAAGLRSKGALAAARRWEGGKEPARLPGMSLGRVEPGRSDAFRCGAGFSCLRRATLADGMITPSLLRTTGRRGEGFDAPVLINSWYLWAASSPASSCRPRRAMGAAPQWGQRAAVSPMSAPQLMQVKAVPPAGFLRDEYSVYLTVEKAYSILRKDSYAGSPANSLAGGA